jgi:mRNA-degrading endonuclease toxin of MazEF toxin-antitoxin module
MGSTRHVGLRRIREASAVNRGDVVLAFYPFASGSGGKRRPGLVVQNDADNARMAATILGMVQSQVTGGHAERGFLTAAQHRLQRRRTGSGDQPRSLARGHVHRYPRPDLPGRPPVRVGVDTASTDCCAQKRYYLEILRNFFPKNGQRLRPIFPPNCKVCVNEILKTQHCIDRE